ncbi:hypothetical protein [Nonomuraea aridisoli]|uniref:hypothetical protein n=1 Tax=Nonomuraea aridisoli TaxID=2070368 RepID=UPI0011B945F2|nr:hypothetical protein [Nonomuraea aridisoli]
MHHIVDGSGRRADWQRRALRFAWQLLTRSTRDMTTSPKRGATWATLAAELGVSRRTIASLFAWFIAHGLLHRVLPGTTARFRKGTLAGLIDDGRGNEAAQYQLIVPLDIVDLEFVEENVLAADEVPWPCETVLVDPARGSSSRLESERRLVDGSCTPNPSPTSVGEDHPRSARASQLATAAPLMHLWPAAVTPRTRAERLRACERLRKELPVLARISTRHLRSLLRQAMSLGATISDIRHALDFKPDGMSWIHTDSPRWVPGWIRCRLVAWITLDGGLVAPWPSQQRAAAAQRARAERAELPIAARAEACPPLREVAQQAARRGARQARQLLGYTARQRA